MIEAKTTHARSNECNQIQIDLSYYAKNLADTIRKQIPSKPNKEVVNPCESGSHCLSEREEQRGRRQRVWGLTPPDRTSSVNSGNISW